MRNVSLLTAIGVFALLMFPHQVFGETDSEAASTSGTSESRLLLESKDLKKDSPVMKDLTLKQTQQRLPSYYSSVVTQKQRDDIYAIQRQYQPLIQMLSVRLEALREEMNKRIRDVLSEEQQEKVDQLGEDARNRRRGN